jgi:hypothetical protein
VTVIKLRLSWEFKSLEALGISAFIGFLPTFEETPKGVSEPVSSLMYKCPGSFEIQGFPLLIS